MAIKVGDEVVTRSPLWHRGEDVGDRLGKVVSTQGHVVVELYDYNDNPIKCFRNEVERIKRRDPREEEYIEIDIEEELLL